MREKTKREALEAFAGIARLLGTISAIFAAWFAAKVVMRLLDQEPFGAQLLVAIFAGIAAAVLITVRADEPPGRQSRSQD